MGETLEQRIQSFRVKLSRFSKQWDKKRRHDSADRAEMDKIIAEADALMAEMNPIDKKTAKKVFAELRQYVRFGESPATVDSPTDCGIYRKYTPEDYKELLALGLISKRTYQRAIKNRL